MKKLFGGSSNGGSMSRGKSMRREKSKSAAAGGAGGPISEAALADEPQTVEEFKAKSKDVREKAERLERENEALQAEVPLIENMLRDEQKLEDNIRIQKGKLERAQKILGASQTEKKMFEEGINQQGGNTAISRLEERLEEIEKDEFYERTQYDAMKPVVQDQQRMIDALVKQISQHESLSEPAVKPTRDFNFKYSPPEYKEWREQKRKINEEGQRVGSEIRRQASGKHVVSSSSSRAAGKSSSPYVSPSPGGGASSLRSRFETSGSGGGVAPWALPDASVGDQPVKRVGSGKKQSKWEVKTYGMGSRGGSSSGGSGSNIVKGAVAGEKEKVVVGGGEGEESSGASVGNLFAKFETGEIQKESERAHETAFQNKEFDRSVFNHQSLDEALEEDGELHRVQSEGMKELEALKNRSKDGSSKKLSSKFEDGDLFRQQSHEQEFHNKEFDESVIEKGKVSKKFLL